MAAQVSAPMPPSAEALSDHSYEYQDTRDLVELVRDAAELVRMKGAAAFDELRVAGSRWRRGEQYVFVLDVDGNMLVHPDPDLEGRNTLDLTDVNGKPIGDFVVRLNGNWVEPSRSGLRPLASY